MQAIYIKKKITLTERKMYHATKSFGNNKYDATICMLGDLPNHSSFASHFNNVRYKDDLDIMLLILFGWATAF